jgi:hypothetical protein
MKLGRIGIVVLAATALGLQAQDSETLVDNTLQLRVTLSLDRTTYFPGEAAVLTLTVINPTAATLPVLAPFNSDTGCLNIFNIVGNQSPALMGSEIHCFLVDANTPTALLASSEQRQATLNSYDPFFDIGLPAMPAGMAVPTDAGYYMMRYSYGAQASAAWTVVSPHVEAVSVAQVQDGSYVDAASGDTLQYAQYMHAFALRWAGQSYICVTQSPTALNDPPRMNSNGDLVGDSPGPYIRVASSQNSIVSLTLTADPSGNLTLLWQDSAGSQQTLPLAMGPQPHFTGPVHVGMTPAWIAMSQSSSQQFTADVVGASNTNVNWSVSLGPDAPPGVSTGAISASGVYSSPSSVTVPYTASVTAQSQQDAAAVAVAFVRLIPPVSVGVAPATATINTPPASQTVQFTATVTGTPNTGVIWSLSGPGTISETGLYTAPATATAATVTVTATSQEDPARSASATITIHCTGSCGR